MLKKIAISILLLASSKFFPQKTETQVIAESNKDVLILSRMIRDHLKATNARNIDSTTIVQLDTLKRISANFESIELQYKGGHISVLYKHTKSRPLSSIQLTPKELEMYHWGVWKIKKTRKAYDGEIRLAYGERFYHIRRITIFRH